MRSALPDPGTASGRAGCASRTRDPVGATDRRSAKSFHALVSHRGRDRVQAADPRLSQLDTQSARSTSCERRPCRSTKSGCARQEVAVPDHGASSAPVMMWLVGTRRRTRPSSIRCGSTTPATALAAGASDTAGPAGRPPRRSSRLRCRPTSSSIENRDRASSSSTACCGHDEVYRWVLGIPAGRSAATMAGASPATSAACHRHRRAQACAEEDLKLRLIQGDAESRHAREERVPGQHEPRDPHADDRGAGLRGAAARRKDGIAGRTSAASTRSTSPCKRNGELPARSC